MAIDRWKAAAERWSSLVEVVGEGERRRLMMHCRWLERPESDPAAWLVDGGGERHLLPVRYPIVQTDPPHGCDLFKMAIFGDGMAPTVEELAAATAAVLPRISDSQRPDAARLLRDLRRSWRPTVAVYDLVRAVEAAVGAVAVPRRVPGKRQPRGDLDTLACACVVSFETPGPDYRPNWKRADVAEVLGVTPSSLAKRLCDGRWRCPRYRDAERRHKRGGGAARVREEASKRHRRDA